MEENELIAKCQRGDREALGELYSLHSVNMMRVICRYVSDWDAAKDILHDGFLVIFREIGRLREPSKLLCWMSTIMKNLSLSYLKSLDAMDALDDTMDIPEVPDFGASITMEELEGIIQRLPKGYQQVFRLAVLEKKSHKEIAAMLGIKERSSSSQLFHAKVLMRRLVNEYRLEHGLLIAVIGIGLGAWWLLHNGQQDVNSPYIANTQTAPVTSNDRRGEDAPHSQSTHDDIQEAHNTPKVTPTADSLPNSDHITWKYAKILENLPKLSLPLPKACGDSILSNEVPVQEIGASVAEWIDDGHRSQSSSCDTSAKDGELPAPYIKDIAAKGWSVTGIAQFAMGHTGTRSPLEFEGSAMDPEAPTDTDTPSTGDSPIGSNENLHYDLPLIFSLSMARQLNDKLSLETGLRYTLLRSTRYVITADDIQLSSNDQRICAEFIGVPLAVNYHIAQLRSLSVYYSIGVAVDIPVSGKVDQTIRILSGAHPTEQSDKLHFTPSWQWSATTSVGLEYRFSEHLGLYAEPSLNYYFKASSPYPLVRQARPFEFTVPIGIRLNW